MKNPAEHLTATLCAAAEGTFPMGTFSVVDNDIRCAGKPFH